MINLHHNFLNMYHAPEKILTRIKKQFKKLSILFLSVLMMVVTPAFAAIGNAAALPPDPSLGTNVFPEGMVTLTFDDGWTSQYQNVLPVLNQNGLNGTFFIISQPMKDADAADPSLNSTNQYMNTAQVQAIQNAGNEIGVHTVNHCSVVTSQCPDGEVLNDPLTPEQEITNSKDAIASIGSPADTFAYPYGEYNANVESILQNNGFIAARSVDDGYNTLDNDRYALQVQNVTSSTTVDEVKTWIDTALANHYWLILVFHQVESPLPAADIEGTTPDTFSQIAAYLKDQQAKVVTLRDGISIMDSTTPSDNSSTDNTAQDNSTDTTLSTDNTTQDSNTSGSSGSVDNTQNNGTDSVSNGSDNSTTQDTVVTGDATNSGTDTTSTTNANSQSQTVNTLDNSTAVNSSPVPTS